MPNALEETIKILQGRHDADFTVAALAAELDRRWVVVPGLELDTFLYRLSEEGLIHVDINSERVTLTSRRYSPQDSPATYLFE